MNEIDRRLATTMMGLTPNYACRVDTWFAWRPVRLGALGGGRIAWLERVRRDRCMDITIYQELNRNDLQNG